MTRAERIATIIALAASVLALAATIVGALYVLDVARGIATLLAVFAQGAAS